jgi:uncharacterized protein (TIGR03435 family)
MARMAAVPATAVGRPVVDRTGLAGLYDLSVMWDDAPVRDAGMPGTQTLAAKESPAGDDHGSIFTAVQEATRVTARSIARSD